MVWNDVIERCDTTRKEICHMKRTLLLMFLTATMLLEANALRVRNNKITYEVDLSAHTAEVIEIDQDFKGSLTIPDPFQFGYDDYTVIGIADNACKNRSGITRAIIPETVTYMGKSVFQDCKNLQSVNIPKDIKRIEYATFMGCESLTSVVLPEGVEYIGVFAFQGCLNLESINFPNSINEIDQYACSNTALTAVNIQGNGQTTIGNEAFRLCQNVKKIEIGDGVVSIGDNAFWHCWRAESVVIGNHVKTIGADAFNACDLMTSLTLGEGLEKIGVNAFADSYSLKEVHIPSLQVWCNITFDGVKADETWITNLGGNPLSIAKHLFINDEEVKGHLVIPEGVTKLADGLFRGWGELTSVTIPGSVKDIGHYTFAHCKNLDSVILEEGTETIGYHAFLECFKLKEIVIPNSVKVLSSGAFSYCTGMTDAKVGNGVTTIESTVFGDCSSLTSVILPEGLTTIGAIAFCGCKSLPEIILPEQVETIGENAFSGCTGLKSVTFGSHVTSIGNCAFMECKNISSVYISDLAKWCSMNFERYSNPLQYAKHLYVNDSEIKDLTIPDGVTAIGNSAFAYFRGITSLYIPNTVITIGEKAFLYCEGLTTATIPSSVTSIEQYALAGCSNMTDIYVHATTPMEIKDLTFGDVSYQKSTLHVPSGSLNNYTTADYWKNFVHIVDDIEPSSYLSPLTADESNVIFDINGHRLPHYIPGVNIIKYKNGEIRKRYIRTR